MTIKELEERTGMTRSNIRFYEGEGLLSPARNPNGYRDYSEADADTLEKIQLLRRLGLDLDAIRALQRGELDLAAALERQMAVLNDQQAALERAREVCARLREREVSYVNLRPRPWLAALNEGPAAPPTPPEDVAPPHPGHPWRRYFARVLDLSLYGLPILSVELLVLHVSLASQSNNLLRLLNGWLELAILLIVEPVLLHVFGTTPGKAALGITVRDSWGNKLSLGEAFTRTLTLISSGMGWGIPGYSLYRQYKCYKLDQDGEWAPWQYIGSRQERMTVSGRWTHWVRWGLIRGAGLGMAVLIYLGSFIPPNRGELDLAGFAENYNFYAAYLGSNAMKLRPDGTYDSYLSIDDVMTNLPQGGVESVTVNGTAAKLPRSGWELVTENGTTAFRYTLEKESIIFHNSTLAQSLGVMACAGAQGVYPYRLSQDLTALENDWNYDYTFQGLRVEQKADFTCDVRHEHKDGKYAVYPNGHPATLHLEFTVGKAE